jgi:hypothetical protein
MAFLALLGVSAYGFWSRHLWRQQIWAPEGIARFLIFLAVAAVWFGAWILFRRKWLPAATLAAVAIYTAFAVGVLPLLAAVYFLFACFVLGSIVAPRGGAIALLAGLSIFLLIASVLAHFPVNYPLTYAALLAAPMAVRPRTTAECFRALALPQWKTRRDYALLALALIPLLAHLLIALKPEVSDDALSMHLVVPSYLAQHHLWSFDFHHWVWAVMPMGGVWGYSIAYLLGGEFAARLLNFGLLCVICALVYRATRRWELVALFASTPIVQLVTGSLFIETFYAALIFGALAALWDERWNVCALLLGAAMAVKLTALFFVAPIAIILAIRAPKRRLLDAAAIILAAASLPYVYAWAKTGDPVFPFYNNIFHSPWFEPIASPDPRFSEPLSWRTPFDLTFETHRYWEGQDGSAGFQLLLLAPLALLAASRKWRFPQWTLAATAFGATLLGLALKPNLRYLYPSFPLLTAAIVLAWVPIVRWAALAVAALNLAFLPSSSWFHKAFCLNPLDRNAPAEYLASTAPARLLIDRLNRDHPGESALFLETMDIAGLRGEAWSNGWHDREFVERLTALRTPAEVQTLFAEMGLRHYIYPAAFPVRQAQVAQFLAAFARPETETGGFVLASLNREPVLVDPGPAPPGRYDDFDTRVRYFAHWSHDPQFEAAAHHSVTYSDVPGAAFQFRFHGAAITWVYTRAANRGAANVTIDGAQRGQVDLYSPETVWQARTSWTGLATGDHVLVVTSAGKPGRYIDLDELIVE